MKNKLVLILICLLISVGLIAGIYFLDFEIGSPTIKSTTDSTAEKPEVVEEEQPAVVRKLEALPDKVDIKINTVSTADIINIKKPDALIISQRLSNLPKDILANPIMKSIFSKDFLFYYENSAKSLNLEGTIRRIIFEHKLKAPENLIKILLSAPTEVAFWKTSGGKLKHFIAAVEKTAISDLMQMVVQAVKNERALKLYKKLTVNNKELDIYRLTYGEGRKIYFTFTDNHYFFFSDTSMLTSDLLSQVAFRQTADGIFSTTYGLKGNAGIHSVILSVKYLSFGYQRFFPSLEALGFFFDGKQWQTWSLTDTTSKIETTYLFSDDIWRAVPGTPALCSAIPVEPMLLKDILDYFMQQEDSDHHLLKSIVSATAVCWYGESRLFTPLVIARADDLKGYNKIVGKVFDFAINGRKQKNEGPPPDPEIGYLFQKMAYSYGDERLNIKLAYWNGYLLFSPDGQLVQDAMDTINKQNIALVDQLPKNQKHLSLIISPQHLSGLLRNSIMETLSTHGEELFMEGVTNRLFPVFDRMTELPIISLSMPKGDKTDNSFWEKLEWYQGDAPH